MQGYLEADADLIDALARMLGGNNVKSYREAIGYHEKASAQAQLRARADASDPDLLAAWQRDHEVIVRSLETRRREALAAGLKYAPINDWSVWRDFCDESTWARICAEQEAAGHPLPNHLVRRARHLRAVAWAA